MKTSFDSSELIADVREDIALFGANFAVWAIYEDVEGNTFITDYTDAEKPTEDEAETAEEYAKLLKEFEEGWARASQAKKSELMTLGALLDLLENQNKLI